MPLRGAFHDNWLIEAKSEWLWKNRAQQEMFRTGTGLDAIYKANLNQLLAYSKIPGKNILPEQILALNRFSYFQICRVYLSRCLKKVHWDGSLEGQQLGSEKLLILLEDYLRFSGDWGLVQQHRQAIKRVGNWLVYQLEQFIRSKSKIGLEHLIWACASVKSLAYLWEQLSENRESHLYFKYYWVFWTKLFALLNQVYKEKLRRYQYQGIHSRPLLKDRVIKSLFQILSVGSNQRYLDGLVGLIAQNFQNVSGRPDISINDILLYGEALLREGLDYSAVIKKLIQNASPTWSWPEQTDGPNTNYVWHSACVCYQFLLFYRELFLREEEETLTLLPGFFRSGVEPGRLELKEVPTRFGLISLKTAAIGDQIQLEYSAVYRQEPEKILVNLGERYRVTYVNALYLQDNGDLELGADFKILRLKRTK